LKKILCAVLILSFLSLLCALPSCGGDPPGQLERIVQNYKKNGLISWWEALAVYGAGENPADFKGFGELLASLEGEANLKMASYVIVASCVAAHGESSVSFGKYEKYRAELKTFLENPSDAYPLNDYIFGYLALKCSGADFESSLMGYLKQVQKPDGGFNLSAKADSGDVDMTGFAVFALRLPGGDAGVLDDAIKFLEGRIGENGTFSSYGSENANSTAIALSALSGYGHLGETIEKATAGLALFRLGDGRYSFLEGGEANALATAQAAIALGDLENNMSVWERLYLAMQD